MNNIFSQRLSVRMLWVVTTILLVFTFLNTQPIMPHDFWWHITIGREILSSGQIPLLDEYSFTMQGAPYPSYQMFWLMDVLTYMLFNSGGAAWIVFMNSLIITAAYLLILILCWKISHRWGVTTVCLLFAIALGIHNWNIRPQVVSYLIGAAYIYTIYAYRQKPNWRWLLIFPLGMIFWVNSHGSFVIGFLLLGLWLCSEVWEVLLDRYYYKASFNPVSLFPPGIALIASFIASLINPRGSGVITYVTTLSGNPVIQNLVPEWAPPTIDTQIGAIYLIGFLFCACVFALSPKRPTFFQIITFLTFSILSFKTTRGIIWFGMVMAPILTELLPALSDKIMPARSKSRDRRGSLVLNSVILILLLIMAIISLPWFKSYLPFPRMKSGVISQVTPVEATSFLLDRKPEGRLFSDMGFSSYLIWAAQDGYPVFVDPRIELYPQEIWEDYIWITNALPGWEDTLNKYDIRILMLDPVEQTNLNNAVKNSSHWRLLYEDQSALIYVQ